MPNSPEDYLAALSRKSDKELVLEHIKAESVLRREDISMDMNRRLVSEIRDFNHNSSKQAKLMIILTIAIIGLTLLQFLFR